MILKNNLYHILYSDPESKSFRLELIPDSMIYKAHFPEKPITPGVCIIQTATELLKELLTEDIELATVSNVKFLNVINPLETKEITYTFTKIIPGDNELMKISAVVSNNENTFTKLSLVYHRK